MARPAALHCDRIHCTNCPQCRYPKLGPYSPIGFISFVRVPNFFILGRRVATVGDKGFCGGPTTLTTGAYRFIVNGTPLHRVTDFNSCMGVTIGPGAPTFLVGD